MNPVIEWNRTLLAIVRTPGAQPPTIHSTRSFAMLHAAIFDAVNNIDRDFEPYAVRHPHVSRRASAEAAADQAAHDVLISLYPAFATALDSELQQDLAQFPYGRDKTDGIEEGQDVAAAILALRSNDGSATVLPPFMPKNQPGSYQLTPPNFAPADFIQWAKVTPFALAHANEFRPSPPPDLTSDEYTRSFDDVFISEGARVIKTPIRAPNANAFSERSIGTIRREVTDRILILGPRHLNLILRGFADHYNSHRPHQGIDLQAPDRIGETPAVAPLGQIRRRRAVAGLISEYYSRAA